MIEIRDKIEALRNQFKTETGENYINSQGEPDIEYMSWMEERLVKEFDSLPCVRLLLSDSKEVDKAAESFGDLYLLDGQESYRMRKWMESRRRMDEG